MWRLFLIVSFLTISFVRGQVEQLELPLSSNNIEDIEKQSNGLFWIATDEGLNVFYDNEKHVFYSNIKDSLSLLNSKVHKVKITSKNKLIAFSQDGLSVFNSDEFNFTQIKLLSKPVSVVEDIETGDYWIATENSGYYILDKDFKTVGHYTFDPLNPFSISTSNLRDNDINSIVFSKNSKVLIATKNGVNVFDKKLKTFKRYFKGKRSNLTTNIIIGITKFNDKLIVASENEIVIFDEQNSNFESVYATKSPIKSLIKFKNETFLLRTELANFEINFLNDKLDFNNINSSLLNAHSNIISSNDSFFFWNTESSSLTQTDFNFNNEISYAIQSNINFAKIIDNNLYLGSNEGVKTLQDKLNKIVKLNNFKGSSFFYVYKNFILNFYNNTIEIRNALGNREQIFQKKYDFDFSKMSFETDGNLIYFGGNSLNVFDIDKKLLIKNVFSDNSFNGNFIDNIKIIDDTLFASYNNGLLQISKYLLTGSESQKPEQINKKIVFHDYNELLNINAPRGFNDIEKIGDLYYLTNRQSGLSVYKENFSSFVRNFKYDGNSSRSLSSSTPTKLMYIDKEKTLYIGSIGSGLFKYQIEEGIFSNLNLENGMLSNNVYDFLQTPNRLFFQSGTGINFIENNTIKNLTIEDGLISDMFHSESLHVNSDNLLITGNEFVQAVPFLSIDDSENQFLINNFNIVGIDELNNRKIIPIKNNSVNIDYNTKTLLFDLFTSSTYKSDQIQYFAERDNNEVIKNGYNNQIQLSTLPYYTSNLSFYAINGNGVKSENVVSFSIYNAPPWWLRIESIVSYIVFLIIFIWFFVKYREKVTKERLEGERKSKELEEAKELQNSLLPKVLPNIDGFSISTYLKPATEIGGDYYDFFYEKGEYFYAICGDATGHGVISGIMVSVTKAGLNGIPMGTPSIILEQLNRIVKRVNFGRLRMSLSVAKFRDNTVELSSAAMPPTYFYSSKTKEVEEVLVPNLPLGGLEGEKFDGVKKEFNQDDVMIMISDGLPELPNPSNDLLDYEKVNDCIKKNATLSAVEIKNALVLLSDEWSNGVMNPDDITIVVVKKSN